MSVSESDTDATTVLAAASIEVVAELGRVTLRGDELLGLAPGAVLAVGAGRTTISLRVGGEVWADGEIVDIDGELGCPRHAACQAIAIRRRPGTAPRSRRSRAAAADQRGALVHQRLDQRRPDVPVRAQGKARRTALSISKGVAAA